MKVRRFFVLTILVLFACGAAQGYAAFGGLQTKDGAEPNKAVVIGTKEPSVAPPARTSANWWATVQKNIRKSEYNITWQEKTYLPDVKAAYQAPNRAHNMRTYFAPEGIRVIPRTSTKPQWTWGLNLKGYGFKKGDVQPVQQAKLSVSKNRIEFARGSLAEWYVNDERGLEQGFTLNMPPRSGRSDLGPWVVLQMDVYGNLRANLDGAGNAVDFTSAEGADMVRFSKLHVSDVTGRKLTAKFALSGSKLDILIDTSQAVYPIIVDPLATSPDWTAESDQAYAEFGCSVGTAGDVNDDTFDDVIVGAPYYDNGHDNEGRAFVYYGSGSGLSSTADWTAEGDQQAAYFGWSVGTAGDVNGDNFSDVIVGAPDYDSIGTDEGAAFVYHGSSSGLSTSADWTYEGNQAGGEFGYSVGTAGNVNNDAYDDVIIGAPSYENAETKEGRVYVFHGSTSGPSVTADWTADSGVEWSLFGSSVGTAGDVDNDGFDDVIIGAAWYGSGGSAFVYHGSLSGLSTSADWTAQGGQDNDSFGWSVGTAGDVNGDNFSDVIVGAPDYDSIETDEGATFVYHGSLLGLSTSADWIVQGDEDGEGVGYSVGTAGDVNNDGYDEVIVGAPYHDSMANDGGKALLYGGSASGLNTVAGWNVMCGQPEAYFGWSVGTAGDVNNDEYDDFIVGASKYTNDEHQEGGAFLYAGAFGPINVSDEIAVIRQKILGKQRLEIYGAPANGSADVIASDLGFGNSTNFLNNIAVTGADIDGDGTDEIVVIRQKTTGRQRLEIYEPPTSVGGDTGARIAFDLTFGDASTGNKKNIAMAGVDIDGDGTDEIAVIRENTDNGNHKLEIYTPPAITIPASDGDAVLIASDLTFGNSTDNFNNIAIAGADIDGDGTDELAVIRQKTTGKQRLEFYNLKVLGVINDEIGGRIADDLSFGDSRYNYNNIALAGLDVDGDGVDEIAVIRQKTNGRQRLEIYDAPGTTGGETGLRIEYDLTFGDATTNKNNILMTGIRY